MNTHNLPLDSLRSLSRIFSAPTIRKNILKNEFTSIDYRINRHLDVDKNQNYSSIIKSVYNSLLSGYRNEYVYKNEILTREFIKRYTETSNAIVLDELKIGDSIADVTILNGEVKIFEIKTELDSFTKLKKQINDYTKFADKIYIVVSPSDKEKALDLYKDTPIGIIYLSCNGNLREIQKATNTEFYDHEAIFKILKKEEYGNIVKDFFNIKLDLPNTLVFRESLKLVKTIDIVRFQKMALTQMKKRTSVNKTILYSSEIPHELKYLYTQLNLDTKQHKLFERFLHKTLTT